MPSIRPLTTQPPTALALVTPPVITMADAGAQWHQAAPATHAIPPAALPAAEPFCAPWLAAMHRDCGGPVSALGCWSLAGATVSGRFLLGHAGRTISGASITPAYVRSALEADALPDAPHLARPVPRRIRGTLAVIGSLGYETFGHWLLDILPRLWVLRAALGSGADALRFAVPHDLPEFGRAMLAALGIEPGRLVPYRRDAEALQPDRLLVPTLMHEDYRFHPSANAFFDATIAALAPPPRARSTRPRPTRLLLSRDGWNGDSTRRLVNGAELSALLEPRGFATIRPETLPWPEQIALFAGARVVVGEHGSAMKSLVFARPGTAVVNLHFLNLTQSNIAALRGHRLAYLDADILATSPHGVVSYRIDPGKLLACLDLISPDPM